MCLKEIGRIEVNVTAARQEHQAIVSRLMNGPGDSDGAMHRAERVFGLPYWSQWNLRHKRRATIAFMQRVREAYLTTIERSVRRDLECLKAEKIKGADDVGLESLVAEAEALLARISERVKS
jgi:hypothetical protein